MSDNEQAPATEQPAPPAEPTTSTTTDPAPAESSASVAELTAKLEKYQEIARKQEQRAKENAAKAAEFDKLTEQSKTDLERAQEEAKRLSETATAFRTRAVLGEAKALATDFANPAVAVQLLGDLSGYVGEDGDIDGDRIKSDLADLLKREPYLARVQEPAGMRPNPAQGQSGKPPLTASQQARESEKAGDWRKASAVKADQLIQLSSKFQ